MNRLSEDEIVARLNASEAAAERMALNSLGLVAVMALVFAAIFVTGHAAWLQNQAVQIVIAIAVGGAFLLVFLRMARKYAPPVVDASDPAIVRRRIDAHHRTWRWTIFSSLFSSIGCVAGFAFTSSKMSPADRPYVLLYAGTVTFVILLSTWVIAVGPGWLNGRLHAILNDEFVQSLRARTLRLGYAVTMAAGAIALLIGVWRPNLAIPSLAWALYAGFAIPALYYVVADWRASRER